MLANSEVFLCSQYSEKINEIREIFKLNLVPKNLQRTSPTSFLYCNTDNSSTHIMEWRIGGEARHIEQLEGKYSVWDFCNDSVLLVNTEGDFLFYNFLSKNSHFAEKQHPGTAGDIQVMHADTHFVTCGGCVKNPQTNASERLIKTWKITEDDALVQRSRLNTGHKKPIEKALLLNQRHVASMSTDRSVRFTDLVAQQMTSMFTADFEPLSGCQMDYNSVLIGGMAPHMRIYDMRIKKTILQPIKIHSELIQVVHMKRFADHHIMVANINELHLLDLRNLQAAKQAQYDGERICEVLTLNRKDFIVGNLQRTFQLWEAS